MQITCEIISTCWFFADISLLSFNKKHLLSAPFIGGLTTFLSLLVILTGQALLMLSRENLNPTLTEDRLWKIYRRSPDPIRRREAALILVSKSTDSPHRIKRLLSSQAWGQSPIAATVLKLQAENSYSLGNATTSQSFWELLLTRFPYEVSSADAYYFLGRKKPELRKKLLLLF